MSRRASREARLVRGLTVAAAGSGLAIAGHLVGGGSLPTHPGVLLAVAMSAAACTLLSDREWSAPRLLVALGSIEVVVHLGLALGHAHVGAAAARAAGTSGWSMLIGHAAAAVLTAWLLRSGEQAYWQAVDRLRWRPLPRPVALTVPAAPALRTDDPAPLVALLSLAGAISRRGPPALAT